MVDIPIEIKGDPIEINGEPINITFTKLNNDIIYVKNIDIVEDIKDIKKE